MCKILVLLCEYIFSCLNKCLGGNVSDLLFEECSMNVCWSFWILLVHIIVYLYSLSFKESKLQSSQIVASLLASKLLFLIVFRLFILSCCNRCQRVVNGIFRSWYQLSLEKRAKNNINIQNLHDDKIKEFVPVIVNWETNYSTTTSIG